MAITSKTTMELEKITPEIAKRYLGNNVRNRNLKQRLVEQLASDIKGGDFHVTHQGIAFDAENNLIDGQHRLSAIILADKPVQMYVTRGLHKEMMNVVDIGSKRTQADVLSIHGYGNSTTLSAAGQVYYSFLNRDLNSLANKKRYVNNFKLLEFVKEHPELLKAVEVTHSNKRMKMLGSAGIIAAFYCIFHRNNKTKAAEFFRVLVDNHSEKRNHPAVILNEHILRKRAQNVKVTRAYLMAALIRAWENFVNDNFTNNIVLKDPLEVIRNFK